MNPSSSINSGTFCNPQSYNCNIPRQYQQQPTSINARHFSYAANYTGYNHSVPVPGAAFSSINAPYHSNLPSVTRVANISSHGAERNR